jgi:hypothetical protein
MQQIMQAHYLTFLSMEMIFLSPPATSLMLESFLLNRERKGPRLPGRSFLLCLVGYDTVTTVKQIISQRDAT